MTPAPVSDNAPIPDDDPARTLSRHAVGDGTAPVVRLVGNEYTILVSGAESDGKFTVIDMLVPPGGGPPPHRHDFEETFTVLGGEIQATFRGETVVLSTGDTINIPANAPHSFTNAGDADAHLLCICAPAGQDEFFRRVDAGENPGAIAAEYRTVMLGPPPG